MAFSFGVRGEEGSKGVRVTVIWIAAVLLSGNNFDKIDMFVECLSCSSVSCATFNRIQSLYTVPVVKDLWGRMKDKLWEMFSKETLVMSDDGRMDSPGFSAKYCVYTSMDHCLHTVLDLEVVDKRETGGNSTIMEKMALKRLLERIMAKLSIGDLVTDARLQGSS